ncbi:50S ribosomal protein L23 [archaeon]|nr:50S ribosomal protein L23 [archaeon]
MDPLEVIKHPVSTEKALRLMDEQNKIVFMVNRAATKRDIKKAIEQVFKVKVKKVNTHITAQADKKAYVTLDPSTPADDIVMKMGLT